jgi:hypothetical protein
MGMLVPSGYDLEGDTLTAIPFNDAGEIVHLFNHIELASLKETGRTPKFGRFTAPLLQGLSDATNSR